MASTTDISTFVATLPAGVEAIARTQGPNATGTLNQMNAINDIEAVQAFLAAKSRKSLATKRQYHKEVSRFMAWLAIECRLSVSATTSDTLRAYERFLSYPTPAARWIGKAGRQKPDATGWIPPFAGQLSPASIAQALTILRSMFSFLAETGYLRGNPFVAFGAIAQVTRDEHGRVFTTSGDNPVDRVLQEDEKDALRAAIELLPQETRRQQFHYNRMRWLLALLLMTGLRRAEAAAMLMTDIKRLRDGYFLSVIGKGSKIRLVPMPETLVEELKTYRRSLGMYDMPLPGEDTPLVAPLRKGGGNMTSMEIYRIVKNAITVLIDQYREHGAHIEAERLQRVSTHWLRHTYATDIVNSGADLRIAQDNLGHKDLNTTRRYVAENRGEQMAAVCKAFDGQD